MESVKHVFLAWQNARHVPIHPNAPHAKFPHLDLSTLPIAAHASQNTTTYRAHVPHVHFTALPAQQLPSVRHATLQRIEYLTQQLDYVCARLVTLTQEFKNVRNVLTHARIV
jgi:hypothetical protein